MAKKDCTRKTVRAYINGIAWQHEMTRDNPGQIEIYNTIMDAKRHDAFFKESGIVEVEIKFKKWVIQQRIGK